MVGTAVQYIAGFGTELLLSRQLGASTYGIYALAKRISSIVLELIKSGPHTSLIRFVPKYQDTDQLGMVTSTVYLLYTSATAIVATTMYLAAPVIARYTIDEVEFVVVVQIFAIILLFESLIDAIGTTFRAFEIISIDIGLRKVGKPVAVLLAVLAAMILDRPIEGYVYGIAIANSVIFFAGVTILVVWLSEVRTFSLNRDRFREIAGYAVTTSGAAIGTAMYSRADIVMIGILLSSTQVGLYNVAILLASFLRFPLSALNQLFPPIASRLYETRENRKLENIYKTVTRWSVTLTVLPATWLVVYRTEVLLMFGEEFKNASTVLGLFVVAQLVGAMVGPSGFLLLMTDNERIAAVNKWSMGLVNVILNYVFILEFGMVGAAVVSASVLALMNGLRVVEVVYFEGLVPYDTRTVKPILSGVPAIAGMVAIRALGSGILITVLGGAAGTILYFGTLTALGIEDIDKNLINRIKPTQLRVRW